MIYATIFFKSFYRIRIELVPVHSTNRSVTAASVTEAFSYLSSDRGRRPSSQKTAASSYLYDNRLGYFPMSGKPFSSCASDMIFRLRLDLDETRRFYPLKNVEIRLEKKWRLIDYV